MPVGLSNQQQGGLILCARRHDVAFGCEARDRGRGGAEARVGARTPPRGMPRVGEGVSTSEREVLPRLECTKNMGATRKPDCCRSKSKAQAVQRMTHLLRLYRTHYGILLGRARVHARLRGCGRSQGAVSRPVDAKRVSSAAGRRDTRGHGPILGLNIAAIMEVVRTRTKREGLESRIDLPRVLAPDEVPSGSGAAHSTRVHSGLDGDLGTAFGRGTREARARARPRTGVLDARCRLAYEIANWPSICSVNTRKVESRTPDMRRASVCV